MENKTRAVLIFALAAIAIIAVMSVSMIYLRPYTENTPPNPQDKSTWTRQNPDAEKYLEQQPFIRQLEIAEYVACVNSRFPLFANRWAYVTEQRVAEELARGNLDRAGMAATYASLGCTAAPDSQGNE